VAGVVTQPDRPSGRGRQVAESPVKAMAVELGIPVLVPENVNSDESITAIRNLDPELIVVIAYGQILKSDILDLPPKGCINVHTSLLPKYRGAAPIQWAIANGDRVTGVTTMFMDAGMDTGDIIMQSEVGIDPEDTGETLHEKLAVAGAKALVETVAQLEAGTVKRAVQDEAKATSARKLKKADSEIDWTQDAKDIENKIRAFTPWPGSVTGVGEKGSGVRGQESGQAGIKRLSILMVRVEAGEGGPGEVLDISGDGPLVACGQEAIRLLQVKPEGKRAMSGSEYLCGHSLKIGDRLRTA
jgi:methionyl-tRNA formyltransferase